MFNNNCNSNNNDFNQNNKCCPKVVFVLLPTATTPPNPAQPDEIDEKTPTLSIGTVKTGDPGTKASASITGTAPNYLLNLTIPQGPTRTISSK